MSKVLANICRIFDITDECAVRTGFYRPNLELHCTPVSTGERDRLLFESLSERPAGPTIVYVTLQKSAESLTKRSADAGWPAPPVRYPG